MRDDQRGPYMGLLRLRPRAPCSRSYMSFNLLPGSVFCCGVVGILTMVSLIGTAVLIIQRKHTGLTLLGRFGPQRSSRLGRLRLGAYL